MPGRGFTGQRLAWLLAITVAGALPDTAQATTYLINFTGHVTSGLDELGTFGAPGGDLTGVSYFQSFTMTVPVPGMTSSQFGGSYNLGARGDLLTSSITINGLTAFVPHADNATYSRGSGVYDDMRAFMDYSYYDPVEEYVNVFSMDGYLISYVNHFTDTSNFLGNLELDVGPGDLAGNDYAHFKYAGPDDPRFATYANLMPDHISFSLLDAAVPEPSTWAMMLVGLGATGLAMRRTGRRTTRCSFARVRPGGA